MTKLKRYYFLLILIFLSTGYLQGQTSWQSQAEGQRFSAEATLSDPQIELPASLQLSLKLSYPSPYHVDIDQLKANLLSHSSLTAAPFTLASFNENQEEAAGIITHLLTFTLQPQFSGTFPLTFFAINFVSDSDKPVEIVSGILTVKVTLVPLPARLSAEASGLLPLSQNLPLEIDTSNQETLAQDIQKAPIRNQEVFAESELPWFEIFLLALVALFAALPKKQHPVKQLTRLEQIQEARNQALRELKALQVSSSIPISQQYTKIAEVLRNFLEVCYHLHAPESTTEEFLQEISHSPKFTSEMRAHFISFLKTADLVKFAGLTPTKEECEQATKLADLILNPVGMQ